MIPANPPSVIAFGLLSGGIHQVLIVNDEIFLNRDTLALLSRMVELLYPHHVTHRRVWPMNVFHGESDHHEYCGMPGVEIAPHSVSVRV
jgi:hypothetical protein